MQYQVWTKEDYGDVYKRTDCPNLDTVMAAIDKAVRTGGQPLVTVEVPYEVEIKIAEVTSEITEGKAKPDKSARGASDGEIRRGDPETT